jgi:large conductance mechanosensitive channel
MIARIREWCRSESPGIVLPVCFIALFAVWSVLQAFSGAFIYPIVSEVLEDATDPFVRLEFTIRGVTFDWTIFFIEGVALLLLLALVYYVFVRPSSDNLEEEPEMRECPECLSEILVGARRCAFCSAEVAPIVDGGAADAS